MDRETKAKIIIIYSACLIFAVMLTVLLSVLLTKKDNYYEEPVPEIVTEEPGPVVEKENVTEDKPNIPESRPESAPVNHERALREPLVNLRGNGEDEVTVMIYMNGSNLESYAGFATDDIREMLKADYSDKLHILIETIGTQYWQRYNISSEHTQRYAIEDFKLVLKDDTLPQLNCSEAENLCDFIRWSSTNYPADRYILIFWDHGGGAVDGFGYDEWSEYEESLTLDGIKWALDSAGVDFDFIGMDACIMSSIETCYALYDHCDYAILSEDFESAIGWSYRDWLTQLARDTSVPTEELARTIIDDMVNANDNSIMGSSSTLALIDERYVPQVMDAWLEFAYANEADLLSNNYSREVNRSERAMPAKVDAMMQTYYVTDMQALAGSIDSPYSKPLTSRLDSAIVYYNCTMDDSGLTGLSVTLPYNDVVFYHDLGPVFAGIGIEKRYIEWLGRFQEEWE
ncbi:MAG: hypothetical protein K6B44_07600 [Lachnospiraceae bacterium]|nr:hypothetical protein [Lachnospiraceae bacterium]